MSEPKAGTIWDCLDNHCLCGCTNSRHEKTPLGKCLDCDCPKFRFDGAGVTEVVWS